MTGAMMVLTLKIISAAACYQDGSKPEKVCMLFNLATSQLRRVNHLNYAYALYLAALIFAFTLGPV